MRKTITMVALGALLACVTTPLMAVGFGRLVNATTLGQPLDVTIPINADVTEQIVGDCVHAEVMVGDSVLPLPVVRVRLEASGVDGMLLARVTTTVRVQEPVVNVAVSAGCPPRTTRQYVVFVDPPLTAFEPVAAAAIDLPVAAPPLAVPGASASAPVLMDGDDAVARSGLAAAPLPPPERPVARPARRAARVAAATAASTEVARARRSPASARKANRRVAMAAQARSVPRLQLERSVDTGAALAIAPSEAASAATMLVVPEALAASAAVPDDADRAAELQREALASLQQRLDRLQAETEAANTNIRQLQSQLRDAQAQRSPGILLYALLAAVAGLLLWIALLLARRRSTLLAGAPWWNADAASPLPPSAARAAAASGTFASSATMGLPEAADAPDDGVTTDPAPFSTAVMPPVSAPVELSPVAHRFGDTVAAVGAALVAESPPSAKLTADELIDLEQQAAFFVALGQDDSAVDLLDTFLRGAGSACRLPYLTLLDIHRRRGEQDAYEQVLARHDMRFGPSVLRWSDEPVVASAIDDHADLMIKIESAWADPPEAMRLVESLLVQGDRTAAPLDLHALSDLQFLYLLARSAREFNGSPGETVDLLLPLTSPSVPAPAPASVAPDVDVELDFVPPGRVTRSLEPAR